MLVSCGFGKNDMQAEPMEFDNCFHCYNQGARKNPWGADTSMNGTLCLFATLVGQSHGTMKTNMEPYNRPIEKESHRPNLYFGIPC